MKTSEMMKEEEGRGKEGRGKEKRYMRILVHEKNSYQEICWSITKVSSELSTATSELRVGEQDRTDQGEERTRKEGEMTEQKTTKKKDKLKQKRSEK